MVGLAWLRNRDELEETVPTVDKNGKVLSGIAVSRLCYHRMDALEEEVTETSRRTL